MAKSAGLAGLKLPLPVYVVNRQMSLTRDAMLGKDGGAVPPVATGGGKSAKKGKSNTGAKAAGAGAVIVDTALTLVPKLTDDKATFGDKAGAVVEAAGSLAGGWAGTLAGAKADAFVGAFAGPFGAAAGGVIGAAVGGFVGSELGQTLVNGAKNLFFRRSRLVHGQALNGGGRDAGRAADARGRGALPADMRQRRGR